jgi:carbon monoxide dehydrogenase subunit G
VPQQRGKQLNPNTRGQISVCRQGKGVLEEIKVGASEERVWRILTSFEKMPTYLSAIEHSKILKREGSYRLVEQTARVRVPLLSFSFRVIMDVIEERPFLYFNQRLGSFASFCGHWRVDPSLAGAGSRVSYYLEAELSNGLKRRTVESQLRRLIRQNLQELASWIDNSGI